MAAAKILLVDDNKLILKSLSDLLLSNGMTVLTANDAEEALEVMKRHELSVVITDNIMPGISGLDFLSSLKTVSPDTVKVMMSSFADLPTVLAAINDQEVFRFVLKPWKDEEILEVVKEGLRRHKSVQEMRCEDDSVLRSLAQTIELKDPSTKGHCDRVAVYALMIAEAMSLPKGIKRDIKYGSWLHDCGKIGVPEIILNGTQRLSEEEFDVIKMHSSWGAEVAKKARLSEVVRNIIHYHHEHFDGSGYPMGLKGEEIPLEARIVSVADVYDALTMNRSYRAGYSTTEARAIVADQGGQALDPKIVATFLSVVPEGPLPSSDELTLKANEPAFYVLNETPAHTPRAGLASHDHLGGRETATETAPYTA